MYAFLCFYAVYGFFNHMTTIKLYTRIKKKEECRWITEYVHSVSGRDLVSVIMVCATWHEMGCISQGLVKLYLAKIWQAWLAGLTELCTT